MIENNLEHNLEIDPELADDRETQDVDTAIVELPEYDGSQFLLPEDATLPEDVDFE